MSEKGLAEQHFLFLKQAKKIAANLSAKRNQRRKKDFRDVRNWLLPNVTAIGHVPYLKVINFNQTQMIAGRKFL